MNKNEVLDLSPDLSTKALTAMEKALENKQEPLDMLSSGLTDFVTKAFKEVEKRSWFTEHMQKQLAEDYQDMDVNSKLALYNIERQAEIDSNYKLLGPTFGAITEIIKNKSQENKQNPAVQIVNQTMGSPLDSQIASSIDPRVTSGLNALFQLTEALNQKKSEDKNEG